MQLNPSDTSKTVDAKGRTVTSLKYTFRSTDKNQALTDMADTMSNLVGYSYTNAGDAGNVTFTGADVGASGFTLSYIKTAEATVGERYKNFLTFLDYVTRRLNEVVLKPAAETLADGWDALSNVMKMVWVVCVLALLYIGFNLVQKAAGK